MTEDILVPTSALCDFPEWNQRIGVIRNQDGLRRMKNLDERQSRTYDQEVYWNGGISAFDNYKNLGVQDCYDQIIWGVKENSSGIFSMCRENASY